MVSVAHYLTRRYVYLYFSGLKLLRSMFFAPLAVGPSCLSKSALSAQFREFLRPQNMPIFVGCFICRSCRLGSCLAGLKSL